MSEQERPPAWALAIVIPLIAVVGIFILAFIGIIAVKALEWAIHL
jgi:hypothetical protein